MGAGVNRLKPERITVYGADWCGDCLRAKAFLDEHAIPHDWIDVDADEDAAAFVIQVNHGFRSVPTIVWPDQSRLVEPSEEELAKKLGIVLS